MAVWPRWGLTALACAVGMGCSGSDERVMDRIDATGGESASGGTDGGTPPLVGATGGQDASVVPSCSRRDGGCAIHDPLSGGGSRLDLLFVVDNSNSMEQEQAALSREFPSMLRKLTTGDHDGDGTPEHTPIRDLHLGVITPDLGMSDDTLCLGEGESGRLQHQPTDDVRAARTCKADYPSFLSYDSGDDPDELAEDFACIALLGIQGCGFEQPLEAALRALWPSADDRVSFLRYGSAESVLSQGDRYNAGFLRGADGVPTTLGIVVVSDENDCSTFDPSMLLIRRPVPPYEDEQPNLRCSLHPENLYPIQRYLQAFQGLPLARGSRVAFAVIGGIPVDLVDKNALREVDFKDEAAREAFYEGILNDERMVEKPDEEQPSQLAAACESDLGRAEPARRLVELARRFGEQGTVQSICGDDLSVPIDIVIRSFVEDLQ